MFHKCADGVLSCKDRFGNNDFRFLSACSGPEKANDGYKRREDIRQTMLQTIGIKNKAYIM
jgi:hypothetical protein